MAFINIVDTKWVSARLAEGNLVLLDVRFSPKEADYGKAAYEKDHLPGAVFVDFKAALTDPAREHGGRSPLPSPERLAKRFSELGIDHSTTVIVYEDVNGPAASRLWWLLKYAGHDNVRILDGGYEAWKKAGLPLTSEVPVIRPTVFIPTVQEGRIVDIDQVRASLGKDGVKLVDARDDKQYRGEESPFDSVAGHIPGAANYFWKDGLQADGTWQSTDVQRERFAALPPSDEIIVYCGSGISATPNVLALEEAGFTNVKLYPGSWSDWISYSENPIATGEE